MTSGKFSLLGLMRRVVFPYHHLWYIQAFLVYITIIYFVLKLSKNLRNIYLLSILLFVIGSYFRVVEAKGFLHSIENIVIGLQLDNLIYLVLGISLANIFKDSVPKYRFMMLAFGLFVFALLLRVMMFFTDWRVAVEHSWYYLVIFYR